MTCFASFVVTLKNESFFVLGQDNPRHLVCSDRLCRGKDDRYDGEGGTALVHGEFPFNEPEASATVGEEEPSLTLPARNWR
jgi:hypothetical protein